MLRALAFLAHSALPDIGEVFQSDKRLRVLFDNLCSDGVVGLRFEPSLSSLDPLQPAFRATSAFVLQAFV